MMAPSSSSAGTRNTTEQLRVLVVDDEPEMAAVIEQTLSRRGYKCVARHDADEAWAVIEREDFDIVVTDLNMPGTNGVTLTDRIAKNRHDLPVIVITAFGSLDTAIATLRAGAYDFITKPFEIDQLVVAVERAIQNRRLREEVKRLRAEVARIKPSPELVGDSPAMRVVHDTVARLADNDQPVLITGETGTGKELVARELHRRGKRKDGPFVAVQCAAVPEALLDNELFGADAGKKSRFQEATGGTLFLDGIGEMPMGVQAKLFRALEGSPALRVVAATNRDLQSLVEQGTFREDLYYRLAVMQIEVPPLRARANDVLLLAQRYIAHKAEASPDKKVRGFSGAVAERLLGYAWPGNVRELNNAIERAMSLARFEELTVEDLPPKVRDYKPSFVVVATEDPTDLVSMEEVERRYIQRVMEAVGENKTQAARILGFDRTTLYRKLERYKLAAAQPAAKE